MDELDVSTEVYASPNEVYEFLLDFPGYAKYSDHLRSIERQGDGGPGTEYAITFGWWAVEYTIHSRVTAVEPPDRIAFEIVRGIDADGEWRIERTGEESCRVHFVVRYHPGSVASDAVSLPTVVSLDWVIDRVEGKVRREAERIVERVVADLEGERRDVDLTVRG